MLIFSCLSETGSKLEPISGTEVYNRSIRAEIQFGLGGEMIVEEEANSINFANYECELSAGPLDGIIKRVVTEIHTGTDIGTCIDLQLFGQVEAESGTGGQVKRMMRILGDRSGEILELFT